MKKALIIVVILLVLATTTGQSANPAGKHYDDFAERWLHGEYVTMMMNRDDCIGGTEAHMRLAPADNN